MNLEKLLQVKGAIIAVDFDNTLFYSEAKLNEDWSDFEYFKVTGPNQKMIDLCKVLQENNEMILWTCRHGKYLDEAVKLTTDLGLRWDAVNDNLYKVNREDRKVWCRYLIDDTAINPKDLFD